MRPAVATLAALGLAARVGLVACGDDGSAAVGMRGAAANATRPSAELRSLQDGCGTCCQGGSCAMAFNGQMGICCPQTQSCCPAGYTCGGASGCMQGGAGSLTMPNIPSPIVGGDGTSDAAYVIIGGLVAIAILGGACCFCMKELMDCVYCCTCGLCDGRTSGAEMMAAGLAAGAAGYAMGEMGQGGNQMFGGGNPYGQQGYPMQQGMPMY